MAKIIRLTESDLSRIVKRVISEQKKPFPYSKNRFTHCAKLEIKSPGFCEVKTKEPVASCEKLGVKTPGICYVSTKKLVPTG